MIIIDPKSAKRYNFKSYRGLKLFKKYADEFSKIRRSIIIDGLKLDIELINKDCCEPVKFGVLEKNSRTRTAQLYKYKTQQQPSLLIKEINAYNENENKKTLEILNDLGKINVYKKNNKHLKIKLKDLEMFKILYKRLNCD